MIFVDTSFWLALAIPVDDRHGAAVELLAEHERAPLGTSNLIVGETWTFVRRRFGHRAAVATIERLERTPRVQILRVGASLEVEAWDWLRRRDEREYSYVDATSFALMRANAIRDAFAFDGDFSAAGFLELRP